MSTPKLRVALLGCGAIGLGFHLPAITRSANCELVAVCDKDADWANTIAHRFDGVQSVSDYAALVELVDAVVIATPNSHHFPAASYFLSHGKHVLCEKPVTTELADAERLFAISRETGARLMVGQSRRFEGQALALRRLVDTGCLGEIVSIGGSLGGPIKGWAARSNFRLSRAESGGGALIDSGVHLIDMAVWLVGSRAERCAYWQSTPDGWEVEGDAEVRLVFANGARVVLTASYLHEMPCKLLVRGTHGWAEMYLNAPILRFSSSSAVATRRDGEQRIVPASTESSLAQIDHFGWCVQHSAPFLVQEEQVLESLRIIGLCYGGSE
jgi:predicted dehydrogenase